MVGRSMTIRQERSSRIVAVGMICLTIRRHVSAP
jgi:hypothetical protein